MWLFNRNVELSEKRKRILRMMDEQAEKDRLLTKIYGFLEPVTERALIVRRNYLEVGNEIGEFKVSEVEMGYIKQLWKLLSCQKEGSPVMYLGMDVVIE